MYILGYFLRMEEKYTIEDDHQWHFEIAREEGNFQRNVVIHRLSSLAVLQYEE